MNRLSRPQGNLAWLWKHMAFGSVHMIGAVGTEERWKGALELVSVLASVVSKDYMLIRPPRTARRDYYDPYLSLLASRREEAEALGVTIEEFSLKTVDEELVAFLDLLISSAVESCGQSIVIDLSCIPKRFFFPLLKRFKEQGLQSKTLIACYSSALSYAPELFTHADEPEALPCFGGPSGSEPMEIGYWLLCAGFQAHRIPEMPIAVEGKAARVVVPFPPGPPALHRCYGFLRDFLKVDHPGTISNNLAYIPSLGCSEMYDLIEREWEGRATLLLPLGPKPLSLAMCLFAMNHEYQTRVEYAQPLSYNPMYSSGIRRATDGLPQVAGFVLAYEGNWLY